MGCGLLALLTGSVLTAGVAGAGPALNLYEWLAVAPTVIVGEVVADDQRLVEVEAQVVLRGDLPVGARILVDQRSANRRRREGERALQLENGTRVLLLLEPSTSRRSDAGPVFDLVRDIEGTRVLPTEGSEATIGAAATLARIQDLRDDRMIWGALGDLLFFDGNPVLIETVLDLHLKFRRGGSALIGRLEPLLTSPRPEVRAKAVALVGSILEAGEQDVSSPDGENLVPQVIGLARRDPVVEVRVEATRALGRVPGRLAADSLRDIAEQDASQDVRYEAKRILLERARSAP